MKMAVSYNGSVNGGNCRGVIASERSERSNPNQRLLRRLRLLAMTHPRSLTGYLSPILYLVNFVLLPYPGADLQADFIAFFGGLDIYSVNLHGGNDLGDIGGMSLDLYRI